MGVPNPAPWPDDDIDAELEDPLDGLDEPEARLEDDDGRIRPIAPSFEGLDDEAVALIVREAHAAVEETNALLEFFAAIAGSPPPPEDDERSLERRIAEARGDAAAEDALLDAVFYRTGHIAAHARMLKRVRQALRNQPRRGSL